MGRIIAVYGVIAGITVAVLMRIAMMLFPEGGTGGGNRQHRPGTRCRRVVRT